MFFQPFCFSVANRIEKRLRSRTVKIKSARLPALAQGDIGKIKKQAAATRAEDVLRLYGELAQHE